MDILGIIKDELGNILERTKTTALKDGTVSEEEAVLIDLLANQLDAINQEIEPIVDLMTDLSEAEIRSRVKIVSREVVPKMTRLAKQDNRISKDEAAILDTIAQMIIDQ
ncbi:MAG: hypothetical protein ACXAE3_00190 [Candidatus Kariarchaeaceae archaeon]|jgi:hypothetical protein